MKRVLICTAAALLLETGAQAALVSYSVEGEGPILLGEKSSVNANSGWGSLDPRDPDAWHGPDAVIFNPVGKTTIGNLGVNPASGKMTINTVNWWMNGEKATTPQNAAEYSETISRNLTLYVGGTSQTPQEVTQTLTLNVVTKKCNGSETQTLTISGGGEMNFTWNDSQGTHALTITIKDPTTLTGCTGINANSASLIRGCVTATWEYELIPVPEAGTIWAGALLVLPFGLSAFRSLRRNRE